MSTAPVAIATFAAAAVAAAAVALGQGVVRAAFVSPWVELQSARVRLVAGAPAARPAKTYLAGVEITLAEGWKTYWRTPGDAGVPPAFDWTGSSNVAAIKVRYPAPSRLPEAGAQTLGYKTAVTFPIEVVPGDPGKPVDLKLGLDFGVCREICIPAEAKFAVTLLPSQLEGSASRDLLAALERVPRPQASRRAGDPQLERATAILDSTRPRLLIEARFPQDAHGADVFVEAPEGLYVPQPKRLPDSPGGTPRFEIDLSRGGNALKIKGKTLTVTLVSDAGATETTWTVP